MVRSARTPSPPPGQGYWRRNLNSAKRRSRSKRQRRCSASVDFFPSWRAKPRAAAVRVRCLPRRPLTPTLSPDGGEGISCASSLLLMVIASSSQFSSEQRINLLSHGFIHFDQRGPRPFESFTRELPRGVNSPLFSTAYFKCCVLQHVC